MVGKFAFTDFHVHTRWSLDIAKNGPNFEDYVKVAEKDKINVCFLDHYELYYVENSTDDPFHGNTLPRYLEEVDKIKESYKFALSGLEMDYYPNRERQLREFMDEFEKQFDFIAGTIHETDPEYPFTTREKLVQLVKKKPIKQIVDEFFILSKQMIESKIFKNICHLDTIFRYINAKDIVPPIHCDTSDARALELGRLCVKNNIKIEYNLSGLKYPIGRTFPSKTVINTLKKEGAQIFVGSDSHSIDYFKTKIPEVKQAYKWLEQVK